MRRLPRRQIKERGKQVLTDGKMLEWMYNGGDIDEVCGKVGKSVDVGGAAKKLENIAVCKYQI